MLKTIILIIVSFFAVIGFLECLLNALESISTSKYLQIDDISLNVELSGEVEDVSFLLNTLLLQAERINYKSAYTKVRIIDKGLEENTYNEIKYFCKANSNISVEKCDEM